MFAQTRQWYIHWLYQARKRYGVEILNYAITSKHIHLVVRGAWLGPTPRQQETVNHVRFLWVNQLLMQL